MCLHKDNTTDEELTLVETLGKSMGEESALGKFLQAIAGMVREGEYLCIGLGPVPPQPPQGPPPPGWIMPN